MYKLKYCVSLTTSPVSSRYDSQRTSVLQDVTGNHTRVPQEDHGLGKETHYRESLESSQWHSNSPKTANGSFPSPIRLGPGLYYSISATASLCSCISLHKIMNSQRAKLSVVRRQRAQCLLVHGPHFILKEINAAEYRSFRNSANTFTLVSFFHRESFRR